MTLTPEKMKTSCIDNFFRALNAKDAQKLRSAFTPECQMLIPSSGLVYADAQAILDHLDDFMETFETINFHDFIAIPDPSQNKLAATFTVTLTDPEGEVTEMRNANFFTLADDGRISDVLIIATQPLDKGFQVGRS